MKDFTRLFTHMRNRHYLLFDVIAMLLIPTMALTLRMDDISAVHSGWPSLLVYTLFAMLVKLTIYFRLGMYKHIWRYASIEEVTVILVAVFTAGITFNIAYLLILPLFPTIPHSIPRSVPAIDLILSLLIHGGIRLLSRMYSTEQKKKQRPHDKFEKQVLIIGAGNSGTMIAKEILRDPGGSMRPVGFIDDDPAKQGGVVYGIPVLGNRESIPDVCRKFNVSQILIAMPSASGRDIQAVLKIVEPLRIITRTLPGVSELLTDTVELKQFREVRIDDLLRRDPVRTDMSLVKDMLTGEGVLVTGAGGSIGSELCRLIAQAQPSGLCLLGHGENSIHAIHRELAEKHPQLNMSTVIADIRDKDRIASVLGEHRPAFVYHAAAHKHVPLMEENAVDALTNNVQGTINLLRHAKNAGVRSFTLISTDKAVEPSSIMGVTKRLAELALQLLARECNLPYAAVRFGNVLGSRGSVVPIFMEQIAAGGPVTVTHRDMRRYFMTIPEAVQLVLQASTLHGTGEIYVLDMGDPIRVLDLAQDLISLSGLTPYKDIQIRFSGLRPGEKLVESLFREGETYTRSKHEKIFSVVDGRINGKGSGITLGNNGVSISSFEEFEVYVRDALLPASTAGRSLFAERLQAVVPEFDDAPVNL